MPTVRGLKVVAKNRVAPGTPACEFLWSVGCDPSALSTKRLRFNADQPAVARKLRTLVVGSAEFGAYTGSGRVKGPGL